MNPSRSQFAINSTSCSPAADVDLSYLLDFGGVFEPLRDPEFFGRLFIEGPTIAWPNEADIAPETLYDHVQRAEYEKRRALSN